MRPTPYIRSQALAWLLLVFAALAAAPLTVIADDAPGENTPALLPIQPGHLVRVRFSNRTTNCTVNQIRGDQCLVSDVYNSWPDEAHPYSSIKLGEIKNPPPSSLAPGTLIQVLWGKTYSPACVVALGPRSLIIRWSGDEQKTFTVSLNQITAIPQPQPQVPSTDRGRTVKDPSSLPPPVSRITRPNPPDSKNIQFLDTANSPLSNFKLQLPPHRPPLVTGPDGDIRISIFGASPWYEFTRENQTYRIFPDHPRFSNPPNIVAPLPIGDKVSIDVFQTAVHVFLPDGKPAAGAWVYVHTLRRNDANEDWAWLSAKTDAQGKASFRMLPLTEAQLGVKGTIQYINFVAQLDPQNLDPNLQTPLAPAFQQCLPNGKMEVRFLTAKPRRLLLTDAHDKPLTAPSLATVKLLIRNPLVQTQEFIPFHCAPDSPFPYPDGQYRVDLPGSPSRYFTVNADQTPDTIRISFKPEFHVAGRVLTPSGEPAPDTLVFMVHALGERFNPHKLTPDAWNTLDKTRALPLPLPPALLQTDNQLYTPIALAWTDSQGRYAFDTDITGPVAVVGRTLASHQVKPDFALSKAPDLYAIPAASVTFTPRLPQGTQPTPIALKISFPDPATPKTICEIDPASLGYFPHISLSTPITLRLPASYPILIKLSTDSLSYTAPLVTYTPGQEVDLGRVQLASSTIRTITFTPTDASLAPLRPISKITLTSPTENFKTTLTPNTSGQFTVQLPLAITPDSLTISIENDSPLPPFNTRLTEMPPPIGINKNAIFLAPFEHTCRKLPQPVTLITDAAGRPLPNAAIQVDGFMGSKSFTTDERGIFTTTDAVALLPFRFTVTAPDKRRYDWTFDPATHTRSLPIPVTLPAPDNNPLPLIHGRVLLPDGKPAANCLVGAHINTIAPDSPGLVPAFLPTASVYTDSDGSFRISPTWDTLAHPSAPTRWVVVAQGSPGQTSSQNLGITATLCSLPSADPLTLTLPQTHPARFTLSHPDSVPRSWVEKTPAYLARIDPKSGLCIMGAPTRPGSQSLRLTPGKHLLLNQFACTAPVDFNPQIPFISFAYPTSQVFRFTLLDAQTQKPIPSALLGIRLPLESLASFSDQDWATLITQAQSPPKGEAFPNLITGQDGACEKTIANTYTDSSAMGLYACAKGYVPVYLPGLTSYATPNAQGIKDIRIALQPAARIYVVPAAPPQSRTDADTKIQTLALALVMAENLPPALPPAGSTPITGEPFLNTAIPFTGGTILVPRARFWLIGKDRPTPPSELAGIATPTPDLLWLSTTPINPATWDPVQIRLPRVNTIPTTLKILDPTGKPVPGIYIAPALQGATPSLYQASTNAQGLATLNLPANTPVAFKLSHPNLPAPLTDTAWRFTTPASPNPNSPFTFKLPQPIPSSPSN